ncbi:MAG: aldehyde dehydrogenase [Lachnospiraceae bacterium]|jgi:Fe-S oxidoreductase|nr:aldehyde dehydrogenase [Lachnospiraceae bacterium]
MERTKQVVGKHYRMKQAFGQEELHEREAVCTREDPPGCQAACPLRIDMRQVCAYGAKGDFRKAAAVIRTVTPFLFLLSKHCGGACQEGCKLAELGDGIRLPALERACALYGGSGKVNRFMLPKKGERLAVVGDDLFALACLWELGKKGYEVFWFTACGSMKEVLLGWGLSEEEAAAELSAFSGLRIEIRKQEALSEGVLSKEALEPELLEFDGGIVSPLAGWPEIPEGFFMVEPLEGVEWILAGAKALALSLERYVQRVGAGEAEREGRKKSGLFVTMDGVEGSLALVDREHVTKEGAAAEAGRCIQCQCLECVKGCVYLQHFKRNPRAAIREIYNNMSIVMGNHMANGLINACDECGQCQAACPNGFDYPDVCRIAKRTMVETGKMPPSAHEFALLDQEFSNGEAFLARGEPGKERCRYLFFPGCQAAAVSPDTVEAAYLDLRRRLLGGVGLVLGCCGAVSKWAAREDLSRRALEQFRDSWEKMGRPRVICACPTCRKVFEEIPEMETVGIWEVLLSLGLERKAFGTVAIHDACGARGDEGTQRGIRAFVEALGCQVEEVSFGGDLSPCCGYGGLLRYTNREVAEKKAAFAAGRTDGRLLTYCMACRDQFSRAGANSYHILELAYGVEPGPVPDLSARRGNRLRLKQKLLGEVWKESFVMETEVPVSYGEGVEALMEERMILKSDVNAVLQAYEASKEAVYDETSGRLSACLRLGNVTFWVRFGKDEKGYTVYGAYSHRMTVD